MTRFVVTLLPEIEITQDVKVCVPEGCYGTITPSIVTKIRCEGYKAPNNVSSTTLVNAVCVDSFALSPALNAASESRGAFPLSCVWLFNGARIRSFCDSQGHKI